jgi:hypothetical protein
MRLSNILRKLKEFHVQQIGFKQKQNMKEQKDFNRNQRRHKSNYKWEEDNY